MLSNVVVKTLEAYEDNFKKKFIKHKIFHCWKEIAYPFAEDIFPIKIVGDTVILYAKTSAVKDNFKYIANDILDAANKIVGDNKKIYKNFDYAKNYDKVSQTAKKFFGGKKKSAKKILSFDDIKLTKAEISACKKNVSEIENSELKKIALESFITQKKSYKLKIKKGWHKCKICDALCPAEEIICECCRISERDKMRQFIRQIFLKNPCAKFPDALNQAKKNFPHISEEISIQTVTSERSALIRYLASKISFDDKNSDAVKILISIYKSIPQKNLTDVIIKAAMKELRFNFANLPPPEKNIS